MSDFLKLLYRHTQDNWEKVRADWELGEEVDLAAFWGGIWRVIQEGVTRPQGNFDDDIEPDSHEELVRLMFTAEGGLLSFYNNHKALPTGMTGAKPKLIQMSSVTHRASELLTKISSHMAKLPSLQSYFQQEQLVAYSIGRTLIDLGLDLPSLELESLLEELLEEDYLSPAQAGQVYPVFDSKFDKLLNKEKATQEQVERFKSKLGDIKVLTGNGGHRTVKKLCFDTPRLRSLMNSW